jgi:ABC-type nickel/cobalt efflux system permease component RcnA
VRLRELFTNPWETQGLTWGQLLDMLRFLIVYNPVIVALVRNTNTVANTIANTNLYQHHRQHQYQHKHLHQYQYQHQHQHNQVQLAIYIFY